MKRGPKPGSPAALAAGARLSALHHDQDFRAKMLAKRVRWLDSLTNEERNLYLKLRPVVGREVARAEIERDRAQRRA